MIKLTNLSKKYPSNKEYTLSNINYEFENNGLYFIIGKSGSGKTTLLSLIGAMDYEYEGSIKTDNKELKLLTEKEKEDYRYKYISFAFQDYKSDEDETVYQNLVKTLYITALNKEEIEKRIDTYLIKLDLLNKKKVKIKTLSGGEKKRIALIRALIKDSKILLCDEPLVSLNKSYREKVTNILQDESRKRLVIVITHEKDEIPSLSTTLILKDGQLTCLKSKDYKSIQVKTNSRCKIKSCNLFKLIINTIFSNRKFLSFSFFSIMIALFSIAISFQLTTSINKSIKSSLNKYMDDNSLVITSNKENLINTNYQNVDYKDAYDIKNKYPDYISGVYTNYIDDLNDYFLDGQFFSINYKNMSYNLNSLELNDFLNYSTLDENNLSLADNNYKMKNDELILGLKENDILYLARSILGYNYLDYSDALISLNDFIKNKNVYLNLKMIIKKYNYDNEYGYKILSFFKTDRTTIVNDSSTFNDYFVNDILYFESKHIDEKESDESKITLNKSYGIRLFIDKRSDFFAAILKDEKYSSYLFKVLDKKPYYNENNKKTFNRLLIYKDYFNTLTFNKINDFASDYSKYIKSVSLSSLVYTYTANSYISGFKKPFFFSFDKSKLNKIEDNYLYSSENLEDFQASNFNVDKEVIKSDLLSSSQFNSLQFKSLELKKDINLLEGKIPQDYESILISKGLKDYIQSKDVKVNDLLYVLSLDKVEKAKDKYENIFSQSSLKISGVIDDDSLSIYHESLFPLIYCFSNTTILQEELFISDAVINFNLDELNSSEIISIANNYDESFNADFPMLNMNKEIDNTINRIAILFISFSFIAFISSTLLIMMSLYLIIKRNKRNIGIYLVMGYRKKEITSIYTIFSAILILVSYIFSMFLSFFTENVLRKTMNELLSIYSSSFLPYLIPLLLCLVQLLFVYIFIHHKIKKISPLDSFNND